MHQFLKNLIFIIAVSAVFIGIPFGISKLVAHNFVSGSIMIGIAGLVSVLSLKIAAYYHNRKVDVTLIGYLGGLFALAGGNYAMIAFGLTDPVVFFKLFIIAIAIGLHSLVKTKDAFLMQKVALAIALISVAFFQTLLLLGIGAGVVVILFLISFALHVKHAKQEERDK